VGVGERTSAECRAQNGKMERTIVHAILITFCLRIRVIHGTTRATRLTDDEIEIMEEATG